MKTALFITGAAIIVGAGMAYLVAIVLGILRILGRPFGRH